MGGTGRYSVGIIKRSAARREVVAEDKQPVSHNAGARVTVGLDWDSLETGIQVNLVGPEPRSERQAADMLVWEQGAIYGVRFALKAANAMPCCRAFSGRRPWATWCWTRLRACAP